MCSLRRYPVIGNLAFANRHRRCLRLQVMHTYLGRPYITQVPASSPNSPPNTCTPVVMPFLVDFAYTLAYITVLVPSATYHLPASFAWNFFLSSSSCLRLSLPILAGTWAIHANLDLDRHATPTRLLNCPSISRTAMAPWLSRQYAPHECNTWYTYTYGMQHIPVYYSILQHCVHTPQLLQPGDVA